MCVWTERTGCSNTLFFWLDGRHNDQVVRVGLCAEYCGALVLHRDGTGLGSGGARGTRVLSPPNRLVPFGDGDPWGSMLMGLIQKKKRLRFRGVANSGSEAE